ncbi:uncharacterized protein LOC123304063 [Chrysoperla carnea]|uniref:uncharacterized protein LOC123304063 n=1 Tax=Chrysoperla carnea TaxID=189513 RepID=UPI001D060337|nr:uncharacterized protein LOC123304063 [Chrysoperla carnea]
MAVRVFEISAQINYVFPRVLCISHNEIAPWTTVSPVRRLDLVALKKGETSDERYKGEFYSILSEYPNSQRIYTDGSKTETGVGSAFLTLGQTYSWSMPKSCSVYTAELYAIWQALRFADLQEGHDFVICSDSLSALVALGDRWSMDPLVQLVLNVHHHLKRSQKRIVFIWTPGHVGILGNEIVDNAARQAAVVATADDVSVRDTDIKSHVKLLLHSKWQDIWNGLNAKLFTIKPSVTKWSNPLNLRRIVDVAITRLRIGHTSLTSAFLLTGEQQPECATCGRPLTVRHILITCPQYQAMRQQCDLRGGLSQILGNSATMLPRLVQFLEQSGLLRKL